MKVADKVVILLAFAFGANGFANVAVAADIQKKETGAPAVHPACIDIECALITCRSPFVLERHDGQCCPICHDPTGTVSGGVREVTGLTGEFVRPLHPAAPDTCEGAKCFVPQCPSGHTPGHVQGRCCETCVPGR
mmetsp:Transcript_51573/g.122686  ORF Transcript_51573/g.122686 Transcript_51573/m.122686 type:complete len:135 (-) Transcript_51573:67-471(-)